MRVAGEVVGYLSGIAVVVQCLSIALIFWLGCADFFGGGLFFVGDASVFFGRVEMRKMLFLLLCDFLVSLV